MLSGGEILYVSGESHAGDRASPENRLIPPVGLSVFGAKTGAVSHEDYARNWVTAYPQLVHNNNRNILCQMEEFLRDTSKDKILMTEGTEYAICHDRPPLSNFLSCLDQ